MYYAELSKQKVACFGDLLCVHTGLHDVENSLRSILIAKENLYTVQ
jgi:hypothetical protein